MTKQLDLLDIQGNLVRAYGRFGYPLARYVFLAVHQPAAGRALVGDLTRYVTGSLDWGPGPGQMPRPDWTLNLAFTYPGLAQLGLPTASLMSFSPEFAAGMRERRDILGDTGSSAPQHWDPIWRKHRDTQDVHVFASLNAVSPEALAKGYAKLQSIVETYGDGAQILGGNVGDDGELLDYQDAHALVENGQVVAKEHFGYTDGISDPVFEGMPPSAQSTKGRGKPMPGSTWAPLATGEFLLGHPDEAHEYPPGPKPGLLARNGSYLIYRKLHQNVGTFEAYLEQQGRAYPGGKELLAAKFAGRWRDNGAPLARAPDAASKQRFDAEFYAALKAGDMAKVDDLLSDFDYNQDMSGAKCPFSAHIRRCNPRGSLQMIHEPGDLPGSLKQSVDAFDTPGALSNRRRMLRRGLPYGQVKDRSRDDGNHGIVIMLVNADINRQFEFVQQQWMNYGNDFKAGNDKDILLGNHSEDPTQPSKAVLQTDPAGHDAPHFLPRIPRFVETRGGDYFFVPSLTALRMIAAGVIDPT
ncbi:peroxidase [Ideonella azotifigens]|uniref:Peroxidase n=1 Tax=Ideonella azotifigens TaxID=513160 RepID=A0ABP3VQG6_9BURK|nr:peroxidase [Ideonella azotifigens]MCD2340588.1 peroxidase [Ideonella azotifigens]